MIQINEVELASNLADNYVINYFLVDNNHLYPEYGSEDDLTEEDGDTGCFIYKENVQRIFNRWYDYYYNEIMKTVENDA